MSKATVYNQENKMEEYKMALIKCPECGKEISDKSKQCIHCGYPLDEPGSILYNVVYKGFPNTKIQYDKQVQMIGCLRQLLNLGLADAKKIIDNPPQIIAENTTMSNAKWIESTLQPYQCILEIKQSSSTTPSQMNRKVEEYISSGGSTIICPHCGSNQVTVGQRGFSLISGFWGSQKTTNRCGKCGWTWQPK